MGSKASQGANAGSLEEQIIQANPPLEAYGNAKTVRNNNSSRFGKFIRIHFGPSLKIASADIETYLLEKSRITFRLEIERNYHIFYQLMTDAYTKYWTLCDLGDKPFPGDYFFLAQGVLTVAGMDDAEEMRATDTALDTLGFNQDQKDGLYKGTIAIAYIGNQKWKQKGREEQVEPDGMDMVTRAADLLGIEVDYFVDTFMKPKLKVGKDFVKKGQNVDQVNFSVSATAKSLFARMFDWVVALVNDSLDTPNPRKNFIGVLDIAGFEIFELNVLEQLLINYTNERLQQFFNHHMFVQEQEEYKAEGIQWAFIDFGMDLLSTIELIEKKMGILSMLEEECIVPKATDKTYLEKMMNKHLGKHNSFAKPKPPKKGAPEAHFEVHHYAGTVGYNVTGWLFKNKDPVNEAIIGMMSSAGNAVVALVFTEKDDGSKMTISAAHRESLMKLMTNLHSTHPHFVRCITPNEIKKSGYIDAPLVMHQLNCNGVLEGIRICMLGLPNKVPHADFMSRYSIIAPKIFSDMAGDARGCAAKALVEAGLDADEFRCGSTKIMFRAGRLSKLEEIREGALTKIVLKMQCTARVVLMKLSKYNDLKAQKNLLSSIQRNIRIYYNVRGWGWFQFYTTVKGEMGKILAKMAEDARKKAMAEGLAKIEGMLAGRIADREAVEGINADLAGKKAGLAATIEGMGAVAYADMEAIKAAEELANESQKKLNALQSKAAKEKAELAAELKATKADLTAEKEAAAATLSEKKAVFEGATGDFNAKKAGVIGMESANAAGKGDVLLIMDDIAKLDKVGTAMLRDKKEMLAAIGSNEKMVWTHGRLATLLNA